MEMIVNSVRHSGGGLSSRQPLKPLAVTEGIGGVSEAVASGAKLCRDALDALGLALARHGHTWTAQERDLYHRADAWCVDLYNSQAHPPVSICDSPSYRAARAEIEARQS